VAAPVFEDRGRILLSRHADPNAVRDMIAIADHRGWRMLDVRGGADLRREAWLAGRAAGLEVRGYRPSERDLQDLQRKIAARERADGRERISPPNAPHRDGAADRLRLVEAVVPSRIADPRQQSRLLSNARERIADWLERGARFDPMRPPAEAARI
jgi:hypothetical protein